METQVDFVRTLLSGGSDSGGSSQTCVCLDDPAHGTPLERTIFLGISWSVFAVCVGCLAFYLYHIWKATCGWEEIYVCVIEGIKIGLDLYVESYPPCTLVQISGARTSWLRYAKWLLCCPVILMQLSNLTGLKDGCSNRTMALLLSNTGSLVMGITAAMSTGGTKVAFFVLGALYCAHMYWVAAKVYIEAYHSMPPGTCKKLVKIMAYLFFFSWSTFPIFFILGPEGFGVLSIYGSHICHTVMDFFAKNLWGLCGHELRIKFTEFILIHGNIRKETTINVVGEKLTIEEFLAEEDEQQGAIRCSSTPYAGRKSFMAMRNNLKAKGKDVRSSLDGNEGEDTFDHELGYMSSIDGGARIRPTRRSIVFGGDASSRRGTRSNAGDNRGSNDGKMARHVRVQIQGSDGDGAGEEATAVITTEKKEVAKGSSNNKIVPAQ